MKAWQFIEKGWVQNDAAVDKENNPVSFNSKKAVAWCVYGAILAAYAPDRDKVFTMSDKIERLVGGFFIEWNNKKGQTQANVLRVLKKADI